MQDAGARLAEQRLDSKFLEPFVVVQAFEVDELNKKYELEGYPTLVFADSSGEKQFKHVGYQPAIDFAATVAQGLQAVEQELPAELQTLIDKEVITVELPDETADER